MVTAQAPPPPPPPVGASPLPGQRLHQHHGATLPPINPNTPTTKQALVLAQVEEGGPADPSKYGRSLGEIPACMWRLATNPIYMVTCFGSCMELAIVSGFLIFLPKYLETQFSLG